MSAGSIDQALQHGPYGRCVYDTDNDVVDHQTVNLLFEGGRTATLTMMGFTAADRRQTRVFGTHGELIGDGRTIRHVDFLSDSCHTVDTEATDTVPSGHGGGDFALMDAFVRAVTANDPTAILSGASESLETHRMVFAAERSRCEERVVRLSELANR